MRVAIVCDWLTNFAGAERVVLELHKMFPQAPVYTTIYNPKRVPQFKDAKVITSFLQRFPGAKNHWQWYGPLMPMAIEQFDLSEFDLVISSSFSHAKGVLTRPGTIHICYCHTPMRYFWQKGKDERGYGTLLERLIYSYLGVWDKLSADRVDYFVANSKNVAERIKKYYHRQAEVIYPPVKTDFFRPHPEDKINNYYLSVSRLIEYKKPALVVEAFNKLELALKVVGEGPLKSKLQKMAGPKVEILGRLDDEKLRQLYSRVKAVIFPAEEDFGIVPVEVMACGRPVIAYGRGGATETVKEGITGSFFNEQSAESIISAVKKFESQKFNPKIIRQHALKFSQENFKYKFKNLIARLQKNGIL